MKKNVLAISVIKLSLLIFLLLHFASVGAQVITKTDPQGSNSTSGKPDHCALPTDFTSELMRIESSPVTFEARINWSGTAHYQVELYIGGIRQRSDTVKSPTIYYTDLKNNTYYNILVRPICGDGRDGAAGYEFLTPPSVVCAPLENVNVTTTPNSFTVAWDYPSTARFEYTVWEYFAGKLVAEGATTDHSIAINGLSSNVNYRVVIKAFCDPAYPDGFYYFETNFWTQCNVVRDIVVSFQPTETSPVTFTANVEWTGGAYRGTYEFILTGDDLEIHGSTYEVPFLSFDSLKADTEYSIQIRTLCNGAPSDWVTYAFRTPVAPVVYCQVNSQSVFDDYIHIVSLNTINNTSGFKLNPYGEPTGYADYTNLSTTLTEGETYTLHVSVGLDGQTPDALRYFAAWIDYNYDGDFDDAGERVALLSSTSRTVDINFTVPDMEAVTTRIRIEVKNNSSGTESEPESCGLINAGEIEDYTVIISPSTVSAGARQINIEKKVSTTENPGVENVFLYPNPVKDILAVSGPLDSNTELVVVNQAGQTMFTSSSSRLEVSSLTPGIYNIIIMQNGQRRSLRFLKH